MDELSRDNSEAGGTFTRQASEVSASQQPKFEVQAPELVVNSSSIVEQDFDPWTMNESPSVDFGNAFYLNNPDHFSRPRGNQISQPNNNPENVGSNNPFDDAEESEFSNQAQSPPQVQLTEFGRNFIEKSKTLDEKTLIVWDE